MNFRRICSVGVLVVGLIASSFAYTSGRSHAQCSGTTIAQGGAPVPPVPPPPPPSQS